MLTEHQLAEDHRSIPCTSSCRNFYVKGEKNGLYPYMFNTQRIRKAPRWYRLSKCEHEKIREERRSEMETKIESQDKNAPRLYETFSDKKL